MAGKRKAPSTVAKEIRALNSLQGACMRAHEYVKAAQARAMRETLEWARGESPVKPSEKYGLYLKAAKEEKGGPQGHTNAPGMFGP